MSRKVLCSVCGFMVVPDGHEERCGNVRRTKLWTKEMAYFGDLVLKSVVRVGLYDRHRDMRVKLEGELQSNASLARFALEHPPGLVCSDFEPTGDSDHAIGTGVEAAFMASDQYRKKFADWAGVLYVSRVGMNLTIRQLYEKHKADIAYCPGLDGFAYLASIESSKWCDAAMQLGPYPKGEAVDDYNFNSEVSIPELEKIADVGPRDLNALEFAKNDLDDSVKQLANLPSVLGEQLVNDDWTVCKCQLHKRPVTADSGFATVGCAQKPAGRAGAVAHAFNNTHRACSADELTRVNDAKFARLAFDPGTVKSSMLGAMDKNVSLLSTSSLSNDMNAFGNGYCYLQLLHRGSWWRVVRILGPNPLLSDVARVLWLCGKCESKVYKPIFVCQGYYHFVSDKTRKGNNPRAGIIVYRDILGILQDDVNARVG